MIPWRRAGERKAWLVSDCRRLDWRQKAAVAAAETNAGNVRMGAGRRGGAGGRAGERAGRRSESLYQKFTLISFSGFA